MPSPTAKGRGTPISDPDGYLNFVHVFALSTDLPTQASTQTPSDQPTMTPTQVPATLPIDATTKAPTPSHPPPPPPPPQQHRRGPLRQPLGNRIHLPRQCSWEATPSHQSRND